MIVNSKYLIGLLVLVNFVFVENSGFSQNNLPKWNGYIQTRFASDFDKSSEFTIRRAKLWVTGEVPKISWMTYKMQTVYRSTKDENLMFQDAYADIRLKSFGKIRVGRFVPDFMLQRMQPDYEIPVLERALVVNSFIHNEKQMARQIGISYMFQNDTLPLHLGFGIYNVNIDKPTHSVNNNLLYTSRIGYKIINQKNIRLNIGSSVAYRKLDKSTLTKIYKVDSLISGNDFRWGVEAQFHFNNFELQGEYIEAQINKDKATGYYAIADYSFLNKYQVVALTEKYNDLNLTTNDNAWYGLGFNYQITGKTKIMTDFKSQKSETKYNYLGEIQLQIFFN